MEAENEKQNLNIHSNLFRNNCDVFDCMVKGAEYCYRFFPGRSKSDSWRTKWGKIDNKSEKDELPVFEDVPEDASIEIDQSKESDIQSQDSSVSSEEDYRDSDETDDSFMDENELPLMP